MKKVNINFKKIFILVLSILVLSPLNSFSEANIISNTKISNLFVEPVEDISTGNYENKIADIIRDNYWSNLKEIEVTNREAKADKDGKFDNKFKIAIPKYLLGPDETKINSFATHNDFGGNGGNFFFNFGIIPNWIGLNVMAPQKISAAEDSDFNENLYELANDIKFKPNNGEDYRNVFSFTADDILKKEEFTDKGDKLRLLRDLKKKDSKDSKKVNELKANEEITLDFSTEIKEENEGGKTKKVLLVKLRKKENNSNKQLSDFVKSIKSICEFDESNKTTSKNLVVRVEGLKVSKDVEAEKNISINATASAMYDFATSETEKFYLCDDKHNTLFNRKGEGYENAANRFYWTFAAMQDPEGLDEAAPKDKPNQISYTFKVAQAPKPQPKPEPKPEEPVIVFKPHEYVETHPVNAIIRDEILEELIHEKYIFGYPEDIIKPDGNMTRAEAVSVVARLEKLKLEDEKEIFKDTKVGAWYNKALNAAYKAGYLEEKEGENFRPNDQITRAEVASMLNKLYNRYPDKNFIDANPNKIHSYKDLEKNTLGILWTCGSLWNT